MGRSVTSKRIRRAAWVLPLVALPSCMWPEGDSRVFVTSDPPGARVLLDGAPTGQTTPATLDLGGVVGGDHEVIVEKHGYEPEKRVVTHYTKLNTSQWYDGVVDFSAPALPLFWTIGDVVFPFETRWAYVPHDLFVRLFPEGTFRPKKTAPPGRKPK